MKKVYMVYGAIVLIIDAVIVLTGWSWSSADEIKGVPRSVRDNPGVYRTHYVGGK